MIIAIDGPAASGKGTLGKRIAEHYGLQALDTGSLYRAVALALLDAGDDPADTARAVAAANTLDLGAIDQYRIRSSAVGTAASVVAAQPAVRAALLHAQRRFAAQPGGAVLEGRDIGTVVCPDADVKLFIDATLDQRAGRRYAELVNRGETVSLADLKVQIAERDERDRQRPVSPLAKAPDAHLLDTTSLSIEGAVAAAISIIEAARERPKP
jgi:cytidylate kinase